MSTGALLQLVAQGFMDKNLVAPLGIENTRASTSMLHTIFKKRTPYAIQTLEIDLPLEPSFGEKVTCTIPRKGDVLSKMYLEITLKKGSGATYYPAEAFMEEAELSIGPNIIERHTGEYLRVRSEIFHTLDQKIGYRRLTDFADGEPAGSIKTFWLPLAWFFCEKPLPLISLPHQALTLSFTFAREVRGIDMTWTPRVKLWADYAFLSADERKVFGSAEFEMPITQLQIQEERVQQFGSIKKTKLFFNHSVRWLAWTCSSTERHGKFTGGVEGETNESLSPLKKATLYFNGHERISMPATYFGVLQPFISTGGAPCAGVYYYPFTLEPRDVTVAGGSANFSRIDTPLLELTFKTINDDAESAWDLASENETVANSGKLDRLRIYASTWNILRFSQGECAIAYTN